MKIGAMIGGRSGTLAVGFAVAFSLSFATLVAAQTSTGASVSGARSITKVGVAPTNTQYAGASISPAVGGDAGFTHPANKPMKLVAPPKSSIIKSVPGAQTLPTGASAVVKASVEQFTFHSAAEKSRYEHAASLFPSFCQEWQRLLHDREVNNLAHLNWQLRQGYETATYTGYGQVESCDTKESVEGIPIGKITYEELSYYLAGKTINDARNAKPKVIRQVHTLEIFSWDKNKWFY